MLTLRSESTALVLDPDLGGSIRSFRVDERQILRPGKPDSGNPLEMASFSLVPWCNRIADGTFSFGGRRLSLGGNKLVDEPHALHGHGWMWRWEVVEHDDSEATLGMTHPAGIWPWRYRALQRFAIEPAKLTVQLSLENRSDTPMPYSLGFHPYFVRPGRLTATVDGEWVGPGTLPDRWVDHAPFRSERIDALESDNSFTGWDGRAIVEIEAGRTEIASDLSLLHLFVPRGRSFFAVEPVAAAPDAFNHPERGGEVLDPGATATAWLRIALL